MKFEPVHIEKTESERIASLCFIAACMIVAIHAAPVPESYSVSWWIVRLLGGDGICRIAVPYFFMISGFLLVGRINDANWYRSAVGKRIHSILIPYLIWLLIGLLVQFVVFAGASAFGHQVGISNPFSSFSFSRVGLDPFHNVGYLWYLRDLFVLVLISPLIIIGLKLFGLFLPLIVFGIYIVYSSFGLTCCEWFDFFEYFLSIRGIFYFTLGISIRLSRPLWDFLLASKISIHAWSVGICMLVFKIISIMVGNYALANILDCITVPFLLIGFWGLGEYMHFSQRICNLSFHVYLLHSMFLLFSIAIITIIGLRPFLGNSLLLAGMRSLFAIVMSVFTAKVLKTYCRPMAKIIFGGR